MIRNVSEGARPARPRYDVVVVGGGPAGVSITLDLAERGRSVCLLEGGGRAYEDRSQDLYAGAVTGDYLPLDATRLRMLGGSSNHWGGRSCPLEPIDFEPRPDIGLPGWPIRRDALLRHLPRALELCELGPFDASRAPVDGSETLERVQYRHSGGPFTGPPTAFGEEYWDRLEETDAIDLLLEANAVGLATRPDADAVEGVEAAAYDGARFAVAGDAVVLAMGGIETPRFLLNADTEGSGRFGNAGGHVGRWFMDHAETDCGVYFITRRLYSHLPDWGFETLYRRQKPELIVAPKAEALREAGVPNVHVRLERLSRRPLREEEIGAAAPIRALRFDEDYFFVGSLKCTPEPTPVADSRVTLGAERDRFGLRRVALDHRIHPATLVALTYGVTETAKMLIRSGLGRARLDPFLLGEAEPAWGYASHHYATTRMADTARDGVVDADCRVFGTPNLYVAGSSVFPRAGHVNPTLNIIALALRLSERLARA